MYMPGAPKKSIPLENFANLSRTIESYGIKLYTLVTHSIIHRYGKFHYIIYRIEKITLLLVMANLAVETLSKIVSTIQDRANAVSANTFLLSRDKCLECLPSPFTYCCQTTYENGQLYYH